MLLSLVQERCPASAGSQLPASRVNLFLLSTSLLAESDFSSTWGCCTPGVPSAEARGWEQHSAACLCLKSLQEHHVMGADAGTMAAWGFSFGLSWWKPKGKEAGLVLIAWHRNSCCTALLQHPELLSRSGEMLRQVLCRWDRAWKLQTIPMNVCLLNGCVCVWMLTVSCKSSMSSGFE